MCVNEGEEAVLYESPVIKNIAKGKTYILHLLKSTMKTTL